MPSGDEITAEERDAELAAARLRDTLGLPLDQLDPGERILARVLNRVEHGDAGDESRTLAPASAAPGASVNAVRTTRRRRWPLVAAAAAAVTVVAVITQALGPATPALASPPHLAYSLAAPQDAAQAPSARDVLSEVAETAGETPPTGDGDVMFTSSYGWYEWRNEGTNTAVIAPISFGYWIAPDGSGLTEQRTGPLLRADGTIDPDPGREYEETSGDTFAPGEGASARYPDTLPLEPDELRDALLDPWGADLSPDPSLRAALLIDEIRSLSTTYVLDEDTAAALWHMLAQEEAVVTLGEARDRIGRTVVAVAAPPLDLGAGPSVTVLLIDPSTGRLVGDEIVTLSSEALDVTEPTVTGFTTIVEARFVTTIGQAQG
ncbi:MAG: CU044_5270 family protein [Cellulomonadaceae bacterium]